MCISTFSPTKASTMNLPGLQKIIKTQINVLDTNQTLNSHPTTYCWWTLTNNGDKSKINTQVLNHKTIYDKCSLIIILNGATAPLVPGPPAALFRFLDHTNTHTWYDFSQRRVGTTNTNDEHPCTQQDSSPRSQQARDRRHHASDLATTGICCCSLITHTKTALSRLNAAACVGRLCSVHSSRCVPCARLSTARSESPLVATFGP